MKHIIFPSKPVPSDFAEVIVLPRLNLRPSEADPIGHLSTDIDVDRLKAEDVMCRMLEDVAAQLDLLQHSRTRHDFQAMRRPSRRIKMVATHLGLTELGLAAGHVCQAAQQRDGIALDATMARLERGFDMAVSEVWNFREM